MKQRATKRQAKVAKKTLEAILDTAAMTPAEIATEAREAWTRVTDPDAVAAEVATRGRAPLRAKNGKPARPIVVTDAEGKPTKIVPSSQLLQALLEREGVEGATVEAKRPRSSRCVRCGFAVALAKRGSFKSFCSACVAARKEESRLRNRDAALKRRRDKYASAKPTYRSRAQVRAERLALEERQRRHRIACRKRYAAKRGKKFDSSKPMIVMCNGCQKKIPQLGRGRKWCTDCAYVERQRKKAVKIGKCPCGTPVGRRAKSGLCRPCAAAAAARKRAKK